MKKATLALLFAATLTSVAVSGHEGHAHKVMGTVCTADAGNLEVKTTDGKRSTVTVTDKTKIVRGTTELKPADIQPGARVVATATETKGKDGKTSLIASRVQVGVAGEPCTP